MAGKKWRAERLVLTLVRSTCAIARRSLHLRSRRVASPDALPARFAAVVGGDQSAPCSSGSRGVRGLWLSVRDPEARTLASKRRDPKTRAGPAVLPSFLHPSDRALVGHHHHRLRARTQLRRSRPDDCSTSPCPHSLSDETRRILSPLPSDAPAAVARCDAPIVYSVAPHSTRSARHHPRVAAQKHASPQLRTPSPPD